ncbi:uncharacterized protein AB675_3811 [Cyphellophora attinorum]|uniref:Uncharacterized protein n=1 Tax=Cyphellophora attinorum TaxID=1664694 RepID=A0A0N1NVE2_9EURO|nr:uncharacterized protein AB675_3811 [Phialophora attinorum]KPI34902.1 hypothetical protein AB675_3811 [Phialophora attinorum]
MSEDARQTATLLSLPSEVRALIYGYLLQSSIPLVIAAAPPKPHGTTTQAIAGPHALSPHRSIAPHYLSAQLLATCSTIRDEALPILYGHNTFDISSHFSFHLARPSFQSLLRSLTTLETKHWRNRIVSPTASAFLWRDVKSYERMICTSAQAILQKAPKLGVLAQRKWVGPVGGRGEELRRRNAERAAALRRLEEGLAVVDDGASVNAALTGVGEASSVFSALGAALQQASGESHVPARRKSAATVRVKWRLLADVSQLRDDEVVVDIDAEVAALSPKHGEEETGARQIALDPI